MTVRAIVRRAVRRRASAHGGQNGQALIEFTLVAPLLLVILFAIFDVASALNYLNDETNLANVVARYGSVIGNQSSPPSCTVSGSGGQSYTTDSGYADDVWGFVKCEATSDSSALANAVGVCVTDENDPTAPAWASGDALKITVEYPYNFLKIISGVVGKSYVTLSSNATMMLEVSDSGSATVATWLSNTDTDSGNPAHTGNGNSEYTACSNIT
ncbi:MAG: TadE/TadG family type IV pilus assembly protein [Solirubrobacteraceae bacterium]